MADTEGTRETYYTPGRVAYWIEHWRTLVELSTPTPPAICYDRVSQVPEGMRPRDGMHYADILVDLERARAHLSASPSRHGQQIVVDAMTTEPLDWSERWDYLEVVADSLRVRYHDVCSAWTEACETMAKWLDWEGC